jgi:signal transduction histidine kinase
MLVIDKMHSGSFDLQCSPVYLQNVIDEAVESISESAAAKQVQIVVDSTPVLCMADEQRIMQVLTNLLSNAITYSSEKSSVHISLSDSGDMALVAVEDQGKGIPEEKLATVFEKFSQVESKDASEKKGTGLGLAIAKSIVDQHGGRIGVDSKIGQGSRFWFTVPKL